MLMLHAKGAPALRSHKLVHWPEGYYAVFGMRRPPLGRPHLSRSRIPTKCNEEGAKE